jgi:hypothetical protein
MACLCWQHLQWHGMHMQAVHEHMGCNPASAPSSQGATCLHVQRLHGDYAVHLVGEFVPHKQAASQDWQ